MGEVFAGFGLITTLLVLLAVIAAIIMPFFVIAINGHVRKIREIEHAKFMIFLRHGDVSLSELDSLNRQGLISDKMAESIVAFRKKIESD